MSRAYLALGSNIDAVANTTRAVRGFAASGELTAASTFYRTPAVGHGPPFVNGVIAIRPRAKDVTTLLASLHEIEHQLGRRRGPDKDAPRTIDIDLVAWPGHEHEKLPHADIERYGFVARPLAELNGGVLTASGRPVRDVARAMRPQGMAPLVALTRELRTLAYRHSKSLAP